MVTWVGYGDDATHDVLGQRFDANGAAAGSEFQIGDNTAHDDHTPSVTSLVDGGFVVTWVGYGDDATNDIIGQRFDANGAAVGSEFQVHSSTYTHQYSPSVTSLDDGGFVVTWTGLGAVAGNGY